MSRGVTPRVSAPSEDAQVEDLRISDGEREAGVTALREHAAAGRLTLEELADRVEAALAAHTQGDLSALFVDLPRGSQRPAHRPDATKRRGARIHIAIYLFVSLAMIAIWGSTGAGYFWPIWPILGWGIGVVCHTGACGFGPRVLRRER